jgi:hypothetical protein
MIFTATRSETKGGRCYNHNFRRFSTFFGGKIGVFLKNQCYDQMFAKKTSRSLSKKLLFFAKCFGENNFNHNIGTRSEKIIQKCIFLNFSSKIFWPKTSSFARLINGLLTLQVVGKVKH